MLLANQIKDIFVVI